ncbi:tRNA dimethylallyltransferase [Hyalella azteca]|uniref:tRNA dimethylallyltransferase n=1 Tax=Hyalella azteca TaxID=294128 RepID=A0A8B7NM63_HYAAZ|nr:tRNA dimethylallyltransferase [Hyalella azteca]
MISGVHRSFRSVFRAMSSHPVVVVLGATGAGKSKLAIEIAQKFNGEIISADSMQVYRGLDIITNKVTAGEQRAVKHHLLDFLDPLDDFYVHEFRDRALDIIQQLHKSGKLPVIVGGTHYYIESVLWKVLVDPISEGSVGSSNSKVIPSSRPNKLKSSAKSDQSDIELSSVVVRQACQPSEVQFKSESVHESVDLNNSARKVCDEFSQNQSDEAGVPIASHRYDGSSKAPDPNVSENKRNVSTPETVDISPESPTTTRSPGGLRSGARLPGPIRKRSHETEETDALYQRLVRVDPQRAEAIHPNDRRRIIRSIEIWENTGVRHSEHLLRQKQMEGGSVLGGGLRFSNTVVLWVTCEQEVLNKRLDNRVDEMLQKGLIAELLDFHDQYNKQRLKWEGCETTVDHVAGERIPVSQSSDLKDTEAREVGKRLLSAECQPVCKRSKREHSSADEDSQDKSGDNACDNDQNGEISSTSISKTLNPPKKSSTTTKPVADYTLGIFQSIGFKEFHDYLILPPQERESEKGMMQYKNGVELLKLVTRRYARRQIKWIKNRFTNVLEREVPRMYALDTTNPSDWDTAVHAPAAAIVKALIAGDAPPPDITPVTTTPKTKEEIMSRATRHSCSDCDRVFIGEHQWQVHLAGNKHKRVKQRNKLMAEMIT